MYAPALSTLDHRREYQLSTELPAENVSCALMTRKKSYVCVLSELLNSLNRQQMLLEKEGAPEAET